MSQTEHPLVQAYRSFSPRSEELSARAKSVFPGGDTRSSAHYEPYPLSMVEAKGCRLIDADGHEILDFMNNFTSLIHGHAHPTVVDAVQKQIAKGSAYAAPSENQVELAELIVDRVASIEQLRFTSSGTEGTQMALRCARAYTGKDKIMKMEGGYHGSYETAEVSLVPMPDQRGPIEAPNSLPVDDSFPQSVLGDTVICPYNESELAKRLIDQHAHELAAIVVEPVLGSMGMVPATTEFLQTLRSAASRHNIVLIFDEVITLRLDLGGAQAIHGINPDLTCFGKIVGGGLPIGGIGGKQDLMQLFSPTSKRPVMHASTFSGNALTMAAGLAAMKDYDAVACDKINKLGERLREGFNQTFMQHGVNGQAVGKGSLSQVHFTSEELTDSRVSMQGMIDGGHVGKLFHLSMLRHGVMSATRLMYCTSTAMDEQIVDQAIDALNETLKDLRPYIESERPSLLAS